MAATELSPTGEIVGKWDHERFLCLLFAPTEVREDLFALYAFNHEVAKTREVTSEATLGLIRLEWWRESVSGIFSGQPRAHEVITPLAETAARHNLSVDDLMALINARARDLDNEVQFSRDDLIRYCDETSGQLARLTAKILNVTDTETLAAIALVARAWAVMGILRATGFLASDGLNLLPNDLAASGDLVARDYRALQDHQGLRDMCRELVSDVRTWLAEARRVPGKERRQALPVLLQARLIDGQIKTLERCGFNPFDPRNHAPRPLRVLSLYWANTTGRF